MNRFRKQLHVASAERKPWVVAVISLVLSPIWAMLYLNRGRWAIFYAVMALAALAIPYMSAHLGVPIINPNNVSDTLDWVVATFCFIHGLFIASYWKDERPFKWYAHGGNSVYMVLVLGGAYLLVRTFAFEPFYIYYTSMRPTIQSGDYLLINKLDNEFTPGEVVAFRKDSGSMTHILRVAAHAEQADRYLLVGDNGAAQVVVAHEHIRGSVPFSLWSGKQRRVFMKLF